MKTPILFDRTVETPKNLIQKLKSQQVKISEDDLKALLIVGKDGHTYFLSELSEQEKIELEINLKRYNRFLIKLLIAMDQNKFEKDMMECELFNEYFFVPPLIMPSGHTISTDNYYKNAAVRGYPVNIVTNEPLDPSQVVENHALFSLMKYLIRTHKEIKKDYADSFEKFYKEKFKGNQERITVLGSFALQPNTHAMTLTQQQEILNQTQEQILLQKEKLDKSHQRLHSIEKGFQYAMGLFLMMPVAVVIAMILATFFENALAKSLVRFLRRSNSELAGGLLLFGLMIGHMIVSNSIDNRRKEIYRLMFEYNQLKYLNLEANPKLEETKNFLESLENTKEEIKENKLEQSVSLTIESVEDENEEIMEYSMEEGNSQNKPEKRNSHYFSNPFQTSTFLKRKTNTEINENSSDNDLSKDTSFSL